MIKRKTSIKVLFITLLVFSSVVPLYLAKFALTNPSTPHVFIVGGTERDPVIYGVDPHDSFRADVYDLSLETLFAYNISNPSKPIVSRLGIGYKWIDAMHLEVELRPNVRFHDGSEFNASVVQWNFERLYKLLDFENPILESLYRIPAEPFRNMVDLSWVEPGGVVNILNKSTPLSDFRILFELNIPYSPFIHILTGVGSYMISKQTHINDTNCIIDYRDEPVIGTGPFKDHTYSYVDSQDYYAEMTLVANDIYWRNSPYITDLIIRYYDGTHQANDAMLQDNVDYVLPRMDRVSEFRDNPNIALIQGTSYTISFLAFHTQRIQREIREAICYALDDSLIIENLTAGNADELHGPIPAGVKYYNKDIPYPDYDLSKARQILIDHEYATDNEDWVNRATGDNPIDEIDFTYVEGDPRRQDLCTILNKSLQQIGIKVNADIIDDWDTWWDRLHTGDFEAYSLGWGADILDPTNFIVPMYSSSGLSNFIGLSNATLDGWMYGAVASVDEVEIQNYYNNIQDSLQNYICAYAYLYQPHLYFAIDSGWEGIPAYIFYPSRSIYYIHETSSDWTPEMETYAYIIMDADPDLPKVTDPISDISLEFLDEITVEGEVKVSISEIQPTPEEGYRVQGFYYDISTTAEFTGTVLIGMPYDDTGFINENQERASIKIQRYNSNTGRWEDVTVDKKLIDVVNNIVYAEVSSFSIFAVMLKEKQILTPFVIDNMGYGDYTWTEAASQSWCTGSGTPEDPYVIEDIAIDGENSESCIVIRFSNAHFIIKDCELYNSPVESPSLMLYNVNNGKIINNDCSNNQGTGIAIIGSNDNEVTENSCSENGQVGIYILNSDDNEISENICSDNTWGIMLTQSSDANSLIENSCTRNSQGGIVLVGNAEHNLIEENNCHENQWGILLWTDTNDNTIIENICMENIAVGIGIGDGSYANSVIENQCFKNYATGISIVDNGENNMLSENVISENNIGIYLNNSANHNYITNNIIKDNGWGVLIDWDPFHGIKTCIGNEFYYNDFINNLPNGHRLDLGIDTIWDDNTNTYNPPLPPP
ncbi:MAG: ABC transporter substrate-binding protein [Candidatus Hodarchaeota archaeon]